MSKTFVAFKNFFSLPIEILRIILRQRKAHACWETSPSGSEPDKPERMSSEEETGPDGSGRYPVGSCLNQK